MKKTATALLCLLMMLMMLPCTTAIANDKGNTPRLSSISFKNAEIDGGFKSNVMTYTITLKDNTLSPTLESYKLEGECELFVVYTYNELHQQTGITATVEYPTGSMIYTFNYSNPPTQKINSNNNLLKLESKYCELVPELNDTDTNYKLYIPQDMTRVIIDIVPQDTGAVCSRSAIDVTLKEDQEIDQSFDCVAADGSVKQYTISIVRSNKTLEQVKQELSDDGFASLVKGTRFYEKTEFLIILLSAIIGIILLILLYRFTRKIVLNPIDPDELSFFVENDDHRGEAQSAQQP